MAFMTLEKIGVSYDKKKQILKGLDLAVEKGELVSLLGPQRLRKNHHSAGSGRLYRAWGRNLHLGWE